MQHPRFHKEFDPAPFQAPIEVSQFRRFKDPVILHNSLQTFEVHAGHRSRSICVQSEQVQLWMIAKPVTYRARTPNARGSRSHAGVPTST